MAANAQPRVVVVGGGFGGLESAFYLKMRLGDRARMTLVSDEDQFLFKPNTIYIPFGLDPETLKIPLAQPAARKGIEFVRARATEVDPTAKKVTAGGQTFPYDYLVLATGAGMRPDEIPGLREHAQTVWTIEDMLKLRAALGALLEDAKAGRRREVLFLVPPNNKCSGPLYEMVFMLDTWLKRNGARGSVGITWSTFEAGYIQAFGPKLNEMVTGEFEKRGVAGRKEHVAESVAEGEVTYKNGQRLPYDLLISFPPYVASTPFASIPSDDRGFVRTVQASRQAVDHPDIYVAGDASDFPVKQAFLAFLQADAAAEHLASRILGTQPSFGYDPVSMCVMEQFDKATFAQVPLRVTGDPARPIEVRSGDTAMYRTGTSPMWRLGKKLLGIYLPWRFKAGEPFHAGTPWRAMDIGLKIMSRLMAS